MLTADDGSPATPEDILILGEANDAIERALLSLSPREERALRLRFGFEGEPQIYRQVGETFDITGHRARQITEKALRKLKQPERRRLLRPALEVMLGDVYEPAPPQQPQYYPPRIFYALPQPPPDHVAIRAEWIALLQQAADEVRGTRYASLLAGIERDIATIRDHPPGPLPWRLDRALFHETSRQLRGQIDERQQTTDQGRRLAEHADHRAGRPEQA